jgi:glutamine synthetase
MIKCQTPDDVMRVISEKGIAFIDFKFSDPFGQWQHLTIPSHEFSLDSFEEGIPFDGSSIRGWKGIQESDMLLIPDPKSAFIDPFIDEPTISLVCDVVDPITKEPYNRDPRQIAKKAVEYLKASGIGDVAYFGPEAEFFILYLCNIYANF